MTTKRNCISSGKKFTTGVDNSISNHKSQFNNLNLSNQSHKCTEISTFHSASISFNDKCKQNYEKTAVTTIFEDQSFQNGSCFNSKNNLLNKTSSNSMSSKYANSEEESQNHKGSHQKDSKISSSTLSLHIAAYENDTKAANADAIDDNNIHDFGQTQKTFNTIVHSLELQQPYEFPRQQKENDGSKPEIMQFKSSQKLLDPNQQTSNKADYKENKVENEFEKFKEEANQLFKLEKFKEAAEAYNQMLLQLASTMTHIQKAQLFSNRSAAYLCLKDEASIKQSKFDAEMAIKLNPTWAKGYFRLGRAHAALEEWSDAEKVFEKALALNPESKEVRDELSTVRAMIGINIRQEHLVFSNSQRSKEEKFQAMSDSYGIPRERINEIERIVLDIPGLGDAVKAEHFRDGYGGVRQDYKKAFEYYKKAAEKNIPDAMYNLGRLYQLGKGVPRDYKESMKWLLKAANSTPNIIKGSGIAEAQHLLGLNYSEGVGVDKDFRKAAEWYEKAVANGCAGSANNLGLLYQHGQGVERSPTKAFEYFKSASEKGETPAMINLANCYFNADGTNSLVATVADIAEGMKWLRLAAQKGDGRAAMELQAREKRSNGSSMLDSLQELLSGFTAKNENNPLNYEQFGKAVTEAAKNGSSIAQRHLDIWGYFDDAMKAFKMGDSGAVVSALSKAIHLDFQIVKIPDLFKPVIEKRIKSHPKELDAAVCYVTINSVGLQAPNLIDKYSKLYPNDSYLTQMKYSKCMILKDVDGALRIADAALKCQPKSVQWLYCRAIALSDQHNPTDESIKALDAFLAVAPKDHDKVPACHYRKATYYGYRKKYANFITSFEAGLAAEKEQLPCFLPYFFNGKKMLEMMYTIEKQKQTSGSSDSKSFEQANTLINPQLQRIKNDERRKLLIKNNREKFIHLIENIDTTNIGPNSTLPEDTSTIPTTKKLKKITLKEINQSKKKVGVVLDGTIIDWVVRGNDIEIIIEDENRHGQRLSISNWPSTGTQIHDVSNALKTFAPNYKISIINPSIKSTSDGSDEIQVRGPEFIKIDKTSGDQQKCHCCGNENDKILACSGCMMAKYCSKECQKFDWIELNHKGICKHLQIFAKMM